MNSAPLLEVDLSVDYANRAGVLDGVRLSLAAGEVLGLVGQSGSGKSTMALAIMGLLEWKNGKARGSIRFGGRELTRLKERERRGLRGREIALVLQSPVASLNPALRIETQFHEAWRAHRPALGREEERRLFLEHLGMVNLPAEAEFLRRYPGQVSVGQAQRLLIAMAILHHPRLLIADEPTSALDPITQAEILALLARLNRELGMAILYISHDLLSIASLCRRVAILEQGKLVECNDTESIFVSPAHPYTKRLVEAVPAMPTRFGASLANTAAAIEAADINALPRPTPAHTEPQS
jgi:ABC-type glutathione transport system ATPase component